MEIVSKPPHCENVVKLLDWFITPNFYLLVLERPVPCLDLLQFCNSTWLNKWLEISCGRYSKLPITDNGIFHHDIKPPEYSDQYGQKVKLIDLTAFRGQFTKETKVYKQKFADA